MIRIFHITQANIHLTAFSMKFSLHRSGIFSSYHSFLRMTFCCCHQCSFTLFHFEFLICSKTSYMFLTVQIWSLWSLSYCSLDIALDLSSFCNLTLTLAYNQKAISLAIGTNLVNQSILCLLLDHSMFIFTFTGTLPDAVASCPKIYFLLLSNIDLIVLFNI